MSDLDELYAFGAKQCLAAKARRWWPGAGNAPRGHHFESFGNVAYVVADGYKLEPCCGQAHENPHIDNCMQCAPHWGFLVVAAQGEDASEARNRALPPSEQRD